MTFHSDLKDAYESRLALLLATATSLENRMKEALAETAHIDRIAFRVKETESFCRKCLDEAGAPRRLDDGSVKYDSPLEEVEDQIAGRILVLFRDDLDPVEGTVREWFPATVELTRKQPAATSAFGYESNHYIFVIDEHMKPDGWDSAGPMPTTFELQIRTLFMHAYAEPQHDLGYKAATNDEIDRQFAWIAASAWGADRTMNDLYRRLGEGTSVE